MRITRITTLVIETVEMLVIWRAAPAAKPKKPADVSKPPNAPGTKNVAD